MTDASAIQPLLQTLLETHRTAFELREHEVAFHAISAAAHAAEALEDLDALRTVESLARQELAWLDVHDPAHRHSTRSAQGRRHHSIFEQLAVTAAGMRARIEVDHRIARVRAGLG